MHETELERERHRALVAEGLAVALIEAARRVSAYLQSELQRPDWEHKTGIVPNRSGRGRPPLPLFTQDRR